MSILSLELWRVRGEISGSLRDVVVVVVVFNVQGNEGEALDSRTSRGVWGRAKLKNYVHKVRLQKATRKRKRSGSR
jgi:hypothetical protein